MTKRKNDQFRRDLPPELTKVIVALIAGIFGCFSVTVAFNLVTEVTAAFKGDLGQMILFGQKASVVYFKLPNYCEAI